MGISTEEELRQRNGHLTLQILDHRLRLLRHRSRPTTLGLLRRLDVAYHLCGVEVTGLASEDEDLLSIVVVEVLQEDFVVEVGDPLPHPFNLERSSFDWT